MADLDDKAPAWLDGLLFAVIAVKVAITVWNTATFTGEVYDQAHHLWRAEGAGFQIAKMAYNPPLYYVLAPLFGWLRGVFGGKASADQWMLVGLRATNVVYIAVFYVAWLRGILPKLGLDWRGRALISAWILVLPGYQKLAVMVHPDNLFVATSALTFAVYLGTRAVSAAEPRGWLPLAISTGITGLTRPFAIVPVAVFWAANVARQVTTGWDGAISRRVSAITLIVGLIAGSWYGARAIGASAVFDAYNDKYINEYVPYREGFQFTPYFTTFYLGELLKEPNRNLGKSFTGPPERNPYTNSFWTTAYAETWTDHWLYMSPRPKKEVEAPGKRRILAAAVLPTVWVFGRLLLGIFVATKRLSRPETRTPELAILLAWCLGGIAIFLWWQTGPALLPGKQSTIKFIYNAHLFPVGLTLAYLVPPSKLETALTALVLAALFGLAWPMAVY